MYRKQLKSVDDKKAQNFSPYRQKFLTNSKIYTEFGVQDSVIFKKSRRKESLSISNTFHFVEQQPQSLNCYYVQSNKKRYCNEKLRTEENHTQRRRIETLNTQLFSDDDARLYQKEQDFKLKVKTYFTLLRMQNRLVNLVEIIKSIDAYTLNNYFQEISSTFVDIIGGSYKHYKRCVINECLCLILFLMLNKNIIIGMEPRRWEKLIVYSHQANCLQTIVQLKLQIKGIQQYQHQFQQFQSLNPFIPSQIEKLNLLIEQSIDKLIKNIHDPQVKQQIQAYRDLQIDASFSFYQQKLKVILVNLEKFLYLIPKNTNVYTLVLDLDETLVHYDETTKQVMVRPYTELFLEQMSKHYEIVIFTAGLQSYADKIIDQIDVMNSVKYRLYRHHTLSQGNVMVKDLSCLGRPLSKTIIVDNNPYNFALQPQNGIKIKTWTGDENDRALAELLKYLVQLSKYHDIRIGLKELKINAQYFTTSL